ncbi:MAG: hypothetical protein U0235_33165, partial [Polyangiaceae bacterium]
LVVRALGSGPLASRVSTARVPATLGALVRHVATTARHHLGEGASAVALRAYAASETCEPAIFWALARLAIEHAGGHPTSEVRARALALLDPSAEKLPATAQRTAPTDDPRVSIFERYMLVLTDPEARAGLEDAATYVRTLTPRRAWESHSASFVARALMFGFDDLLEGVLPILLALDPRAASYTPSPGLLLRAMLGHPIDGWETLLREDLRKFHKAKAISTLRRYRWSTEAAAVALAAGDTKLVKLLVGERKGAFRPKLRLGDEPRVVFAYFAQALEQREGGRAAGSAAERKVEREDLEPAWQDLVASRVPDESDRARTGGAFGWVGLLCLAFTRLVRFGGHAPTEVAPLLRAELRGR